MKLFKQILFSFLIMSACYTAASAQIDIGANAMSDPETSSKIMACIEWSAKAGYYLLSDIVKDICYILANFVQNMFWTATYLGWNILEALYDVISKHPGFCVSLVIVAVVCLIYKRSK